VRMALPRTIASPTVAFRPRAALGVPEHAPSARRLTPCGNECLPIERGDTLSALAANYDTSVQALMRANPQIRDSGMITPVIASACRAVAPAPAADSQTHRRRAPEPLTLYPRARRGSSCSRQRWTSRRYCSQARYSRRCALKPRRFVTIDRHLAEAHVERVRGRDDHRSIVLT
jgi:murein DD-endopeptidase MepM/ murein hydrolase activator NlpD